MRRIGSRNDSPASMAKYVVIGEDHEEKDYNSWSVYRNSYGNCDCCICHYELVFFSE